MSEASPDGQASVRELTGQLGTQLSQLVRDEAALARAEMFASARQAVMGSGMLGFAALLGLTGWLALVAAGIAGIAVALPAWAATLIGGGALVMLAGAVALLGRRRLSRGTPPLRRTVDSVRRDIEEIREKARQ